MKIEITSLEALDTAAHLIERQFEEHGIETSGEEVRLAVRGLLAEPSRGAVVIARDPEAVGIVVLAYIWALEHGGRVAWLDELFVVPERRNRGIGRALLQQALEVARDAGCRAVDLEVDAGHARAEELYQREGFLRLPQPLGEEARTEWRGAVTSTVP